MSTYWLSLIADEMESDAGISTLTNRTPAGYWQRIALAAESEAGAATVANANELGWMRRACLAFEALASVSLPDANDDGESAYLARIAYAVGLLGLGPYTGNYYRQIYLAIVDFNPADGVLDFSNPNNSALVVLPFGVVLLA